VAYLKKQSKTWKEAGMAKLSYSCGTCMGGSRISQKKLVGMFNRHIINTSLNCCCSTSL